MAVRLQLEKTETNLFCSSKWWGDPDMPAALDYPTVEVTEDGETYDYPLTFLCQIDCGDLAPFDPEGRLPREGMFYVFAAVDAYAGYDSPIPTGEGEWPRAHAVVRYAKEVNFETFRSCMLVDDEDRSLTEEALKVVFSAGDGTGTELFGAPSGDRVPFLTVVGGTGGLDFGEGRVLHLYYTESDFRHGNWKRIHCSLDHV
ncbi:MAG: DUF1963 domain-containing protein [Bacteroidales bacterium]|nr:DUF1963 domain-containing protein [Bacteroidales bacterium]